MPTDHDSRYHRLFSHPGVVAQLLRGFVPGPWLDDLNLDGMQRLNAKFHARTGQRRAGDMIWRIPHRTGGDTYLVLLLEFQSKPDRYMALRIMAYASLLWQQLEKEQRLPPDGTLPPLLPVVLYNGDVPWKAPIAVRDLFGLTEASPLWQWQPDLRYHLISVGAFHQATLQGLDGLLALWFRLEMATDPGQVLGVADDLAAWLRQHPGFSAAQAVFVEFMGAIMARSGTSVAVPEDLQEVRSMLLERARQWEQNWLREGIQKGEAGLLLRQLERRFGALPDALADRVRAAESADLEEWSLRILDAKSLDDVLREPRA